MKTLLTLLWLTLLGLPFWAEATWVVVTGEAHINDGNVTQARENAIEQALTFAALKGGASFSSMQQTQNGRLTQDTFALYNQSQASKIELLNEIINNDKLIVTLRVELVGDKGQCDSQHLKAAILVPQAQIKDRAQLRYGNIGQFGQALSQRIANSIISQSTTSFPHIHADERLDIKQALVDIRGYRLSSWLSEITDSQYVLLPEILDISMAPPQSTMLGLWTSDPVRQFQLRLSLYHGISGEQIWSESYTTSAPWEFERQETVPSHSQRFWSGSYGKSIDNLLSQVVHDIDITLSCRPILGQIIAKQGDRLIINLGRRHGIKVGDSFQLVLQQNFPDRFDKMRAVVSNSSVTVEIDQISEDTATAVLQGQDAAFNIQVNDIAIKI